MTYSITTNNMWLKVPGSEGVTGETRKIEIVYMCQKLSMRENSFLILFNIAILKAHILSQPC